MGTPHAKKRRSDIQILRAIAVIAVIVFHFDESVLPGGFLGVDVFFVISGFLITGILTRSLNNGTFSLSGFYLRRIKRLFPALALVLLVTLLLGIICLPPIPFKGLADNCSWAALQVSNFSFMREGDYFGPANEINPVLHTWSLGVEEQYYLTWAPLLALLFYFHRKAKKTASPFRPTAVLLLVIVGGVILELITKAKFGDVVSFFSPISRSWELALGGLASVVSSRSIEARFSKKWTNAISATGHLIIVISLVMLSSTSASNPFMRAIPCLGAFLGLLFPFTFSIKTLTPLKDVLVYIGDISYSLYLWHWPMICMTPYLFGGNEQPTLVIATVSLFSIAAILSYHFCEKPFMQKTEWKSLVGLHTSTVVGVLLMIAGGSIALQTEDDSSWRFDGGKKTMAEKMWVIPPQYKDYESDSPSKKSAYDLVGESQVVLIGDSHARHFHPLVSAWAKEKQKRFFSFWGTGTFCLGTHTAIQNLNEKGEPLSVSIPTEQTEVPIKLLAALKNSESVEVVFIAQRSAAYTQGPLPSEKGNFSARRMVDIRDPDADLAPGEGYSNQVRDFVQTLLDRGIKVVLLGQAPPLARLPKPGASILDQLLKRDWKEDDIYLTQEQLKRLDLEYDVYQSLSSDPDVYHLPTRDLIKDPYSKEGHFLYDDQNHLKFQGAMYFFDYLDEMLRPLNW